MNTLKLIWNGLDWSQLTNLLFRILPSLFCITVHELSHGYTAYLLGDPTAKLQGRLTLNPLRHIDPFGLLMMILFKFGWAKPVPVDMYRFKYPKRNMAITALAGPVSNLVLAAVTMFFFGLLYRPLSNGTLGNAVLQFLYLSSYISLGLALFNFLPVSPLDGSKILFAFLPDKVYYQLLRVEKYGVIFLFLLVSTDFVGSYLSHFISVLFNYYYKIALWAFAITKGV